MYANCSELTVFVSYAIHHRHEPEKSSMSLKKAPILTIATLSVLIAAGITAVEAHKGATGVVMKRMMSMKSMGDGMKELAAMVTGKAPYDAARTKAIAATIKGHAADIPKQFPKGSIKGPSEALPSIWQDWDGFKRHADNLAELADKLAGAAGDGKSAALGLFAQMGKTCSGCHQDYRQKKK
jgi:cytochrome c556